MPVPRNIRLNLADYAPPAVLTAPAADKRAFVARMGELAAFLKRREIVRGIGADGKKFLPVKPASRPDGATGAPLDPHQADSRTYRLLAVHEAVDFVTLFWRPHKQKSWQKILGYHARGEVRGAPVRDHFGLSPRTQAQLKADMATWWKNRTRTKAKPKPPPPPPPVAQPKPALKPAPAPRKVARPVPAPPEPVVTRRGRVVYLAPGQKPDPRSKKIQVFETKERRRPTPPPPPTAAAPRPRPKPPKPLAPAANPLPQPMFTPAPAAKAQRMQTVWVDVAKLDAAFQRDSGFAIRRGGEGAIPGRIEGFKTFLAKAKAEGIAIEQSQVVVNKDGSVSFVNGRHRFVVMRDQGVARVPISVPRSQAKRAEKFFGVATPVQLKPAPKPAPSPVVPPKPVVLPPAPEPVPPPVPPPVATQTGQGPLPAAPAPGEPWTVTPDQAKDWVKDSAFPVPLYHRTHPPAKADIEANGINIKKTWGVFGKGLYASTKHEKSFGPVAVEVALDVRNPLIGTGEDLDRLQNDWVAADSPDPAADFRDEVLRRGYDAVIRHFEPTYQGPSGENWVVIMRPETARFVQR